MLSPIIDGVWTRGDIRFRFSEDFSSITIEQNGQTVTIRGNDVTDLGNLMDANFRAEEDEDLCLRMMRNMSSTSCSFPFAEL